MKELLIRITKFVTEDIWKIDFSGLPKVHVYFIRIFRILILAFKGFFRHDCAQKASGLTYFTLISIIPTLAMAFGIAQGFGFKETLEREIESQLSGQAEVSKWIIDFAEKYLDSTKGGVIAGIGFALLLYALMRVLGSIESAFNDIWDIHRPRSFVRKFSDYLSLMIIALLFVISSSSMIVFVRHQFDISFLFGLAGPLFGYIIPYFLIWLVFTFMLYIIPNTNVKFSSALIGGVLSGTAFQLLQFFYIKFQVSLSTLNPIYGSFAAFPIFLIWLNSSWLIVLFGAELSFATQNVKNYEYEFDTKNISYSYKKQILILISHFVVKQFQLEKRAPTMADIAFELKLPIRLITDSINELRAAKILVEVVIENNHEIGYMPSIDMNKLTVGYVLNKIEEKGNSDFVSHQNIEMNHIKSLLHDMNLLVESSEYNKKIIDIS
jgi:membrane protein